MTRRLIDTSRMPRRTKTDRELQARIEELIRLGGSMKHALMTGRLELRHAEPEPLPDAMRAGWQHREEVQERNLAIARAKDAETQWCPTCSMHVSADEAAYCMLCGLPPLIDETPDGLTHITLALPDWWRDASRKETQ